MVAPQVLAQPQCRTEMRSWSAFLGGTPSSTDPRIVGKTTHSWWHLVAPWLHGSFSMVNRNNSSMISKIMSSELRLAALLLWRSWGCSKNGSCGSGKGPALKAQAAQAVSDGAKIFRDVWRAIFAAQTPAWKTPKKRADGGGNWAVRTSASTSFAQIGSGLTYIFTGRGVFSPSKYLQKCCAHYIPSPLNFSRNAHGPWWAIGGPVLFLVKVRYLVDTFPINPDESTLFKVNIYSKYFPTIHVIT